MDGVGGWGGMNQDKSLQNLGRCGSESVFGIDGMDPPDDLVRDGLDVFSPVDNEEIDYRGRRYYPPLNAFQPKIIISERKKWKGRASKYLLNRMMNSDSR